MCCTFIPLFLRENFFTLFMVPFAYSQTQYYTVPCIFSLNVCRLFITIFTLNYFYFITATALGKESKQRYCRRDTIKIITISLFKQVKNPVEIESLFTRATCPRGLQQVLRKKTDIRCSPVLHDVPAGRDDDASGR